MFAELQRYLFESWVQPLLMAAGWTGHSEWAFDFTEWFLIGVIEVVLLWIVLGYCERRWPVEPVTDRAAIRTDVVYTLLHRLGGFALLAFALTQPLIDQLEFALRMQGVMRQSLDGWLPDGRFRAPASFLLYLVLFDFVDYWVHRAQHRFDWWWALHALHHAQRQMTFWSDQRNHLLDDLIRDLIFAMVAALIGVPPSEFFGLLVASRVLQSLQHANLHWRFGRIGERLLVSPSFHRLHHAIGYGHEGVARGCNFAVLLPVWDLLFGTFDPRPGRYPTGVSDQLTGRDYGRGIWAQQALAFKRLWARQPR